MARAVGAAGPSPLATAGSPSGPFVAVRAVQFPLLPAALSSILSPAPGGTYCSGGYTEGALHPQEAKMSRRKEPHCF